MSTQLNVKAIKTLQMTFYTGATVGRHLPNINSPCGSFGNRSLVNKVGYGYYLADYQLVDCLHERHSWCTSARPKQRKGRRAAKQILTFRATQAGFLL